MINETLVTLQGWLGNDPTLRQAGESLVSSFRVGCTPRRFHRASGAWVDGDTQWYTVSAWRSLAQNCARSLTCGDPVVVHGRLAARTYVNKDQVEVTTYEVEALLVGHDLSRGTSAFTKTPRATPAPGPEGAATPGPAGDEAAA